VEKEEISGQKYTYVVKDETEKFENRTIEKNIDTLFSSKDFKLKKKENIKKNKR
jgi:hypothetical protein